MATLGLAGTHYGIAGDVRQFGQVIAGGVLMGLNLAIVVWVLKTILAKKSIALVMFIIVIKYALVLGILIALTRNGFVLGFPFALGVGAVFPTLLFLGYGYVNNKEANDSL